MHDVIKMERTFTYKLTCIFSGLDSFKFRGSSKSEGFVCVPLFNWSKHECSGYSDHTLYFAEIHLALHVAKSLEIMDLHVVAGQYTPADDKPVNEY